jgi:hypothetical protein
MMHILNHIKDQKFNNFDECLPKLRMVKDDVKNLHSSTNWAVQRRFEMTTSQLKFLIEQYSVFSREAIHMLVDAMIRNHDWPELFKELQNNINEEKGEETKGIPHLEIMRRGYEKDLGILTDSVIPCLITQSFINKMNNIFNNNDNAYSAGALLAFEGVAIQEFHIVDKIVKQYDVASKLLNVQHDDKLTNYYINGHKDFEIGHEEHLANSIRPYINQGNISKMIVGYLDVCFVMNLWWEQLMLESMQISFSEENKLNDIEEFNVESAIFNK